MSIRADRAHHGSDNSHFSLAPRGNDMLYLVKLPAIGFRVAVQVFRCPTCMTISSKAPEEAVVKHADCNAAGRQRNEVIECCGLHVCFWHFFRHAGWR